MLIIGITVSKITASRFGCKHAARGGRFHPFDSTPAGQHGQERPEVTSG